jgi:hypothetical protein
MTERNSSTGKTVATVKNDDCSIETQKKAFNGDPTKDRPPSTEEQKTRKRPPPFPQRKE